MLEAWSETVFTTPVDNFGSQIIWNNSLIRIDNNVVMYKSLLSKNVMFVSDLFDQDNVPLPFDHFKHAFGIDSFPFTLYHGLINAIPQAWRRSHCVGTMSLNGTIDFLDKVCQSTSASQVIYLRLINRLSKAPTSRIKWQTHFTTFTDDDWRRFFMMPHLTASEAKLRYFQFKFLHRIIATNRLLYLMKKNDSDVCSFCGTAVETLEHLFWECNVTASFILDVEARVLRRQFYFSKRDFFFGYGDATNHPYNFLILHIKYYIYDCKRHEMKPTVDEFFFKFKFALNIERFNDARISPNKKNRVSYSDLYQAFSLCSELFS